MRIATFLVIIGIFGLMMAVFWRAFTTDRDGSAGGEDGEAVIPVTGEERDRVDPEGRDAAN